MKFLRGLKRSHMIVLAIGLIVIVGALFMSGPNVVGHSLKATTLYEYPYEGFEQVMDAYKKRESDKDEKKPETWTDKLMNMFQKNDKKEEKNDEGFDKNDKKEGKNAEGFENKDEKPATGLKKVEGFEGLYGSPYEQQKISNFGFNRVGEDGTKCKNYGYTNSKGNVCFTPEEQQMLETRGGNYSPNVLGGNL